jgi:hypothetical protein
MAQHAQAFTHGAFKGGEQSTQSRYACTGSPENGGLWPDVRIKTVNYQQVSLGAEKGRLSQDAAILANVTSNICF